MKQDLHSLLLSLDFLPSEIAVYMALLELQLANAASIQKLADISKPRVYDALEALQTRGLITVQVNGKKRLFRAEDPIRLVSYLREKKAKLDTKIEEVEQNIHQFRSVQNDGNEPMMRIFDGKDTEFALFDFLKHAPKQTWFAIHNTEEAYTYFSNKTLKNGRDAYNLDNPSQMIAFGNVYNPRKNGEYRTCTLPDIEMHGDLNIFGKYVVFVRFTPECRTLVIEDRAFADALKTLFKLGWSCASPYSADNVK